jgi:hypothetical protein
MGFSREDFLKVRKKEPQVAKKPILYLWAMWHEY